MANSNLSSTMAAAGVDKCPTTSTQSIIARLAVMSWCFNWLIDSMWVPVVAVAADLDLPSSFVATFAGLNLGMRVLPNALITKAGVMIEFPMMGAVIVGSAIGIVYPAERWALLVVAATMGMSFVRASLSLHPSLALHEEEELAMAMKYCGAARNLGTVSALLVPMLLYQSLGWYAVCTASICVALLYICLAAYQHWKNRESAALASATAPTVASLEDPVRLDGAQHTHATLADKFNEHAIPWIYWIISGAFIVTELQFNICNAAVPLTLKHTFGMQTSMVGVVMAMNNCMSMCFLALLPSIPLPMLHRSPVNVICAFACMSLSWGAAVIASLSTTASLFMPSVGLFIIGASMAQVLVLELLSGVLSGKAAQRLMGTSETVGSFFAMLGGYLGDGLEVYGVAVPFTLQFVVACSTVLVLCASFGHRRVSQMAAVDPEQQPQVDHTGCLNQAFAGLCALRTDRQSSFIKCEKIWHKNKWQPQSSLNEPLLSTADPLLSLAEPVLPH